MPVSRWPDAGDEQLGELRHHAERGGAEAVRLGRHVAPAEDGEPLLARRSPRSACGSWPPPRRRRAGTPCRRRTRGRPGGRSRPRWRPRAGTRRGSASGCRRRRRSWARRPRHRGARGCAARSATWPRCRGWPHRSASRRRPHHRRRARGAGRRAPGAAGRRAGRASFVSRRRAARPRSCGERGAGAGDDIGPSERFSLSRRRRWTRRCFRVVGSLVEAAHGSSSVAGLGGVRPAGDPCPRRRPTPRARAGAAG